MPYKIGSRVQIKEWKALVDKYLPGKKGKGGGLKLPHIFFLYDMKPLCGKCGEITHVYGAGTNEVYFNIKFDNPRLEGDWLFTTQMFLPAKKKKDVVQARAKAINDFTRVGRSKLRLSSR